MGSGLYNLQGEIDPRIGAIKGILIGATWETRRDLQRSGMHVKNVAGISGSSREGAFSIVMSGGYIDDKDEGEKLTYTGTGGQSEGYGGKLQVGDQSFSHDDNRALQKSAETGRPVRVIRGASLNSVYAPAGGYRYDGLYKVDRAYMAKGRNGFMVCKFDMTRLPGQDPLPKRELRSSV
ncbi:hypothetical protein AX17_005051 [Amanita inopinata Kibby_2008]|nr:hypothetical protein AX17_005051 [Amanita inopinata Kibby_2008]